MKLGDKKQLRISQFVLHWLTYHLPKQFLLNKFSVSLRHHKYFNQEWISPKILNFSLCLTLQIIYIIPKQCFIKISWTSPQQIYPGFSPFLTEKLLNVLGRLHFWDFPRQRDGDGMYNKTWNIAFLQVNFHLYYEFLVLTASSGHPQVSSFLQSLLFLG